VASRRDRRRWKKRALKRAVDEKAAEFRQLHDAGFSKSVVQAKMCLSREDADELFQAKAMEEREPDEGAIATVGGGGRS
jgi:hypothetical protein